MAVRASGAHLRAIRREPTHFQAFAHSHLGEKLSEQEHSLAAEPGDLDSEMAKAMRASVDHVFARGFALAFDNLFHRFVRRFIRVRNFNLLVAEYIQREIRNHLLPNPLPRIDRVLAPDGGTG